MFFAITGNLRYVGSLILLSRLICPLVGGNRTTPSYVAFASEERLIGDATKNQAAMNPRNTVLDAKRLIGHRFECVIFFFTNQNYLLNSPCCNLQ